MQYPFTGTEINESRPDSTSTCMTNRCPDTPFPYSLSKASVAKRTPRPVAASLPRDPPRSYIEKKLRFNCFLSMILSSHCNDQ